MTGRSPFLAYGRHVVDEDDIEAVIGVLRSDYLTCGPQVETFEQALADNTGSRHAVVCSSGTAALHLAILGLGLGPGDRVIVPTITFLATANAARFVGAEVIFADVDPATGLMRPDDFERALDAAGGHAAAVVPVHLAGQSPDLPRISQIARGRGTAVVEDACHALGSTYSDGTDDEIPVGSCRHGDMATFSFHPVKTIAMGEGGAVTMNDRRLYLHLRQLCSHGMTRDAEALQNRDLAFTGERANPWYYEMLELGFNYRASDLHCALGLSQLRKLPQFAARRRELAERYDAALADLAPTVRPIGRAAACRPVWHLYGVRIDFEAADTSRAELMDRLRARGIGSQVHYIPVHMQPYYRERYGAADLPGAMTYYRHCLSLPLSAGMSEADVDRVVETLAETLAVA